MISQHWCISHSQDIWCLYNIIVTNRIVVFSVGPVYVLIPRLYAWLSDLLGHWCMGRNDSMPVQRLNYLDLVIVGEENPSCPASPHVQGEWQTHGIKLLYVTNRPPVSTLGNSCPSCCFLKQRHTAEPSLYWPNPSSSTDSWTIINYCAWSHWVLGWFATQQ